MAQLRAYVLQLRAQGFIGDHEAVSAADMDEIYRVIGSAGCSCSETSQINGIPKV
jgi:hypothetical protein